jgi:hypothetical protein
MDRLPRIAPLSGLAFAVLFGIANGLWVFEQPARGADTEELVSFYEDTSTGILVGGSMSLVSVALLVWFGTVLRDRLIAAEGSERSGMPLLAFTGTVLAAAVGLGAETINMAGALAADAGQLTDDTARIYFDLSYAFGGPAAGIAFAMVAIPLGLAALRTGELIPAPTAWLALIAGVAMLTPAMLARPLFLGLYALTVVGVGALSVHLSRTTTP